MNNANPFLPQGSLLEQKNKKRARVKVGVISVLVFNILVISPLLIQGCSNKSKTQDDASNPMLAATNDVPAPDTNTIPALPVPGSNVAATQPPVSNPPPVLVPQPLPQPVQPVASSTQEYVIIKGDTYSTISKKYGVTVKALENANPDVPPSKMKVGKAIHIPAPTTPAVTTTANVLSSSSDTGDLYVVKSGDTLGKIAKAHGVSTTALRAANSLKTDKIKVGDKLKIPAKTTPATPTAPPPSAPDITPLPPVTAPTPGH
jgi:LysM repeat protein